MFFHKHGKTKKSASFLIVVEVLVLSRVHSSIILFVFTFGGCGLQQRTDRNYFPCVPSPTTKMIWSPI